MVSFRGQKKLGPRPDQSPFKFPTSISTPFISGVPPPPGSRDLCDREGLWKTSSNLKDQRGIDYIKICRLHSHDNHYRLHGIDYMESLAFSDRSS